MNFTWNEDQIELYQQAAQFARTKLNQSIIEDDQNQQFSIARWKACGEMGLFGLTIPEKFGGLELDTLTSAFMLEGFGYGCKENGLFLSMGAHLWAVATPILLYGSEELKLTYLPKLASGEWVGAHAISEPQAGSDAMAMSTHVDFEEDYAILNGRKTFVTNATDADLFLVFATGNKKHGFAAISGFVIEKGTPGLSVESKASKMGTRTSPMADVVFDNCRVPLKNLLGKKNLGFKIFTRIMQWERGLILAPFIGAMQREMERCVEYANQREQFGKRLAQNQAISSKIVDMKIRIEAAKLLLYKAAWDLDHGDARLSSSITKLWTSDSAVHTFMDALQVLGGYGYTTEFEIERHLRDAIGSKLYSGTTEMQKMIIANEIGLKT